MYINPHSLNCKRIFPQFKYPGNTTQTWKLRIFTFHYRSSASTMIHRIYWHFSSVKRTTTPLNSKLLHKCVKTRVYHQHSLEKQEILYWVTPKIQLCQRTATACSQSWKLKPSSCKCSSTAGTGAGSLQRRTEISLWNRNLPKATWAKLVIWWKSYQIPEVRLRYYHVMPYFSLLFPLNRTCFSQQHIQSYSAKTAMIISESRGSWGRLGTYNVFQPRERGQKQQVVESSWEVFNSLWDWTGPCDWSDRNLDVPLDQYVGFFYDLLLINYFFIFGCICSPKSSCSFSI